jgi:hypothetical protein
MKPTVNDQIARLDARDHTGGDDCGRQAEQVLKNLRQRSPRLACRRVILNGLIQPFQQPERVVGFFNTYPQLYPVTRHTLRDIADQFQRWVKERAAKRNIPIVEAPKGRRDEFVDPYFK